jgi:hypothetical protein
MKKLFREEVFKRAEISSPGFFPQERPGSSLCKKFFTRLCGVFIVQFVSFSRAIFPPEIPGLTWLDRIFGKKFFCGAFFLDLSR